MSCALHVEIMATSQQADAETRGKINTLRTLLQEPSNGDRVGPLVTALLARDVDIHAKMLTDLGNRVKQIGETLGNDSEHTGRIAERIHNIEQDAMSLRQLIQASEQRDIGTKADLYQLNTRLTEAIKHSHTEMTGFEQSLQVVREVMEKQQQADNGVVETLGTLGQHMTSLQCVVHELKNGLEKLSFNTPTTKSIEKLVERMTKCFDQNSNDARDIKLSLAAIGNQVDTQESLACGSPVEGYIDQSAIDGRTPVHSPKSQGESYLMEFGLATIVPFYADTDRPTKTEAPQPPGLACYHRVPHDL